ncbi:hypothetical protein CDL15_Pgr008139 [Punica granatum]|uniref:Uncharacterized protein n=1 Tax=Punica granatum TaxID=22663 RepID=A0A218VTA9_PUNGR|nr:hypothetical protein CDL15_Pgr008139 [Punica granatum]PKI37838.1 hypothetical protein CRG98_041788 [Punica granatum]
MDQERWEAIPRVDSGQLIGVAMVEAGARVLGFLRRGKSERRSPEVERTGETKSAIGNGKSGHQSHPPFASFAQQRTPLNPNSNGSTADTIRLEKFPVLESNDSTADAIRLEKFPVLENNPQPELCSSKPRLLKSTPDFEPREDRICGKPPAVTVELEQQQLNGGSEWAELRTRWRFDLHS